MHTVIIADDEIIERNFLKSIFKKYPEQFILVGEACNGKQVIDIAIEKKPSIIIMDINMPLYDGLISAQRIKASLDNTIIILNTAYPEFGFARQAINYNLDAYLLKPSNEKDILDTINSCLKRKRLTGLISGSFDNTTKSLNNRYPYLVIDQLINAIYVQDLPLIRFNIEQYLDFIKSQQTHLDKYRLFIINTIFSLERELNRIIPENVLILLNCDQYLQQISKTEYWYEILAYTDDFFQRLSSLFSEDLSFSPSSMEMIAKYIDHNFKKQINLDGLSEQFHFSPSYLSRLFHQNKGITIKKYLNQQRVKYAIYLLQNSNLAIKEVSYNCGFINITHFNRVFKDVTGKAPSQIKKEVI